MPYPQNVETAMSVEAAAVALDCTPATIAILQGRIHVGLTRPQLEQLGQLGLQCRKVTNTTSHSPAQTCNSTQNDGPERCGPL